MFKLITGCAATLCVSATATAGLMDGSFESADPWSYALIGNLTRFAFEAVSATGGNTQGNFIDWCDFGPGVVIPSPGSLALIAISFVAGNLKRRR
jgi:hypothetical protein